MTVEGTGAVPEELEGLPQPGDVVGGKFKVEGVLGTGGMGVVLVARHVQLGQKVAIKVLRRNTAASPDAVSRFLREARTAVNLQSAHVVRVMDVGTLEDGLPYMVMEHLTGTDLCDLLGQRKVLPVQEAVDYVLQAMEAVAEAHALGLVHRDLKPANLFLTTRPDGSGLVKVLDFGISKATESSAEGQRDRSLTATSAVMGSPMYMSPEQLRSSKNVDTRTDIWALGIILYELVSGRFPFEDETVTGLCARIAADPPVPLREHRADVPPAYEAVVARCLAKDMRDRPQTVGELAVALRPFASAEVQLAVDRIARIGAPVRSEQLSAPDGLPSSPGSEGIVNVRGGVRSTTGFADTVGATSQSTTSRKGRRTTTMVAVAGVLAALLLAGGLYVALRSAPARVVASDTTGATTAVPATTAPPVPAASSPTEATATTRPSTPAASATAPPASSRPTATPPAWAATAIPARTTRPAPTTKPPTPDDLLLDRK
jgi:serine/threonine-protein kinase